MTGATTKAESLPESMEEAINWIRRLRDAYNRESTYVKRLERTVVITEPVIAAAERLRDARGGNIRVEMFRVRDAVDELRTKEPRHGGIVS